ncbi:MAG: hypothetical protein QOJ03_3283, partial [Frankiaceae bacterium]|nr:hypothetical protein [Frankiaceae bacterium]
MTLSLPLPPPSREALVEHLVRHRIAGSVATARASNLGNITKMLDRDPDYWFGLDLDRDWSFAQVLEVVADRAGIDPDETRATGADTIDPQRCVDALDAVADLLEEVAARRGRVLFATGHPTGLLALYLPIAAALADAGCTVVTPAAEQWVDVPAGRRRIRYVGGVATLGTGGDLLHTHAPEPMVTALASTQSPAADLVVADHGWAGAAGQAGLRTIGFA